jgi:hypothetical protein
MFKKATIIKETDTFIWKLQYDIEEKKYTTGGSVSFLIFPQNTPCVRLYYKSKFLGITIHKFIMGMKFLNTVNEQRFPFGGMIQPDIPVKMFFQRSGGAGRSHNDASSIYFQKDGQDKYYVEYNSELNTINDMTWMLAYQMFWDNDPGYNGIGIKTDWGLLQKLNEELNLDLFYLRYPNIVLSGSIPFEKEAYHLCGKQEEHFMNMMLADRRGSKLEEVLR